MDQLLIQLLNGLSSGLLLFMLGAGLTLIFSMLGVMNLAHASFYMLGAYLGYTLAGQVGFWLSLAAVPLLVGGFGAAFQRVVLSRVHRHGHVAELLVTFGAATVILELVKLFWGLAPLPFEPPRLLQGPAFTLVQSAGAGLGLHWGGPPDICAAAAPAAVSCSTYPATRVFLAAVALLMVLSLWWVLERTRLGLIVRASITHPRMVQALGHDVPRVYLLIFGGGCGLAGLAGVVGGMTFVTEPSMASVVGSILFVVAVVGGLGSLRGALLAALLVGLLQTLPLTMDRSLLHLAAGLGWVVEPGHRLYPLMKVSLAQAAPILPYLLMVAVLALRPSGLLGRREG